MNEKLLKLRGITSDRDIVLLHNRDICSQYNFYCGGGINYDALFGIHYEACCEIDPSNERDIREMHTMLQLCHNMLDALEHFSYDKAGYDRVSNALIKFERIAKEANPSGSWPANSLSTGLLFNKALNYEQWHMYNLGCYPVMEGSEVRLRPDVLCFSTREVAIPSGLIFGVKQRSRFGHIRIFVLRVRNGEFVSAWESVVEKNENFFGKWTVFPAESEGFDQIQRKIEGLIGKTYRPKK